MTRKRLDAVDRGILHLLQENARDQTPVDMAKRLPVSDGTVRNRIRKMEDDGVIDGYVPRLDYESAGFPLQVVFSCTVAAEDQEAVARDALEVHRVVAARELFSADGNVEVVAVGTCSADLLDVAERLDELGLDVVGLKLVRNEYTQPFDRFGADEVGDR